MKDTKYVYVIGTYNHISRFERSGKSSFNNYFVITTNPKHYIPTEKCFDTFNSAKNHLINKQFQKMKAIRLAREVEDYDNTMLLEEFKNLVEDKGEN